MPSIEIDFNMYMPDEHVCLNYVQLLRQPLLLPKKNVTPTPEIDVHTDLF